MAKFFIDRPIFAWVVAIFIIFAGLYSATKIPVEQYPNIAAPKIEISFFYTGATAETIQDSVISVIEEGVNAVENVDYVESNAYSNGTGKVTLTFKSGVDEDIAQVNVQNKLSQVESSLPQSVRNTGITVSKAGTGFLMITMMYAEEGSDITQATIADYTVRTVKPDLQRVEGVGTIQVFGSEQAMRVWVDPQKMKSFGLSYADLTTAIGAQNSQITAGSLGALPSVAGQQYTTSINVYGQLTSTEDFEKIVVKRSSNGATVKLSDVAIIELGSQAYSTSARLNSRPAIGVGIQLSSSGNAIAVASEIQERLATMAPFFPEGMAWKVPYDTSKFVEISLKKVLYTLGEALVLVFLVMYLFLQNIRYTIIPTIVVPISLLGAVAVMGPLGLTINVLTMFAMVLVIGIVVDDAIVVVENVERLMVEEKLTPYQAAHKGMTQITGAVVGITLVLIAVFIPMAFLDGATGGIYRQFSLVMAASIAFSAFLALSLTPALCATLLKPVSDDHHEKGGFFGWFNRVLTKITKVYRSMVGLFIKHSIVMMIVFALVITASVMLFQRIPSSFLPTEDQGTVIVTYQLPTGSSRERTEAMIEKAEAIISNESTVQDVISVLGFSFTGQGQNMALSFITLKDWSERTQAGEVSMALAGSLTGKLQAINDAMIFAITPPAISSLGTSSGFSFYLQDRNNLGHDALVNARNQMLGMANQSPMLTGVRPNGLEDATQIRVDIDRDAAFAQNVPLSSISFSLASAFGSNYVNDFPNKGRMQRVYVMAEAKARMQPDDILSLTVPNAAGELVPMSSLSSVHWTKGPEQVTRYNGFSAMAIQGAAAPGFASGQAMDNIQELAAKIGQGFSVAWSGQSLEEIRAGNSELYVYMLSAMAVFLCLAALYESWSMPFAVLMVVPLGILGVTLGNYFREFDNDIYFKIGMITVMGLSAKNAILIIEFAKELQETGMDRVRAVMKACALRFRPIIMTSLAFIAGVIPLYTATGASSASQRAIGTSVLWGMLVGTILALCLVPIYYVVVRGLFGGGDEVKDKYAAQQEEKKLTETQLAEKPSGE
ncbi:efflux RND transporter permease subunit [Leucothrix arctica]|uniref:Efflux pump membrane transporter n=1 Tax=Leucothrix arctica TaxID=1481894 RepID=A0A317CPU6_9GAMM|nr:efflux RND transporter permease subunit [Leucothrix arctica]PWQ98400.1 multidrug efflux RND transporter permease subunit [Leucothrix arctica]